MTFKFDKGRRLLCKKHYDDVFASCKRISTPELLVLFKKNDLDVARLGLAISKKSIAKASDRNRLKRLIRETFRVSELKCVDVITLSRKGANKLSNQTIQARLNRIWEKVDKHCKN